MTAPLPPLAGGAHNPLELDRLRIMGPRLRAEPAIGPRRAQYPRVPLIAAT